MKGKNVKNVKNVKDVKNEKNDRNEKVHFSGIDCCVIGWL